jgi:outer membrane protein assembly factor BamE (lipoprotein component of BamABCDE complex)
MKKITLFIILFLFSSNCTLNKVINHHGVNYLEKKQEKLLVNSSNINDARKLLGPPSTKSKFDTDLWIYIERKTSSSRLTKLGKKKLLVNNVLLVEFNTRGLLVKKTLLTKDNMEKLTFEESVTGMAFLKRSFAYDFLSTIRNKINDPLGKKKSR